MTDTLPPANRHTFLALGGMLIASAVIKLVYVFGLTLYPSYVVSDSAHYFQRAIAFYNGESPSWRDIEVYPPGSAALLALYWKLFVPAHFATSLESALALNILASSVTVALLWQICRRVTGNTDVAFLIAGGYSVFYPLVYLNAFTLSEGPAQLFFMLSIWAVVECYAFRRSLIWLSMAGLCWALACLCRGEFLACAPAYVWVLLRYPPPIYGRRRSILYFSLPAIAALIAAGLAVGLATSGTTYRPTGSNGGFNFFMQQCHFFGAKAIQPDHTWAFYPPVFQDQPELGIYETRVPIFQQGFYYKAGFHCLRTLPGALQRLAALGPEMLYGIFYPTYRSAAGFDTALQWSRHVNLILLLLSPAGFITLYRAHKPELTLLLLAFAGLTLAFIFFSADHRHLYSLAFIYFLLGGCGLRWLLIQPKLRQLNYIALALLIVGLGRWLFSEQGYWALKGRKPVTISSQLLSTPIEQRAPWYSLDALRFWAPVRIVLDGVQHEASLSIALDSNDLYELSFWRGQQRLGSVELSLAQKKSLPAGLITRHLQIPAAIANTGYDTLLVRPISGDGQYSMADLRLGS